MKVCANNRHLRQAAKRYAPVVEEYKKTLKIENYDGFLEKIYGLRSRKKD